MTPTQFLEFERAAEAKHQYREGGIVEMARPAPAHDVGVVNVSLALGSRLGAKGCRPFMNNLRVSAQQGELITYPDVTLICRDPQWADEERDTLTNPSFLVEVLSPSAKDYDSVAARGRYYWKLSSMSEYLVIDPRPVFVEHWRRLPNGNWEVAIIRDRDATLRLESLGCEIPVGEIYEDVEQYL